MASISSLNSSAAHFAAVKSPSGGRHSPPSQLNFRPLRVSAASVAGTADRTSLIASPGSYYQILGIRNGASIGEIKSAYRKLARVLHPDVAGKGQTEKRALEFIRIQEAYETLSDPEKRAEYDRSMFRPVSSLYMNAAAVARFAGASGFCRSPRRRWETDQCW